jgi:hypothetical protein
MSFFLEVVAVTLGAAVAVTGIALLAGTEITAFLDERRSRR